MSLGIGEQKGFYDDKRQFQGQDLGPANARPAESRDGLLKLSLTVAGVVGFLIVVVFYARVLASKPHTLPDPDKVQKQYEVPIYKVTDPAAEKKKPAKKGKKPATPATAPATK